MTTSGITSWPLTAEELVTQACYELGTHAAGETPSGEEMNDALVRLNAMLKMWQGEGNLFREATTSSITFASQDGGGLALDPSIREVNNVWAVGSYNRLLAEWNRSEYLSLPNPLTSGIPTAWYTSTGTSGLTLYLYPVPSVSTPLILDYGRKAYTVTDPSETLDFPEEWQEALILNLASRCGNMFGATRTDPNTLARIDQRAGILYQRLLDRDRPDSYYFEPDV
jgi:hypothetical protein